MAKYQKSIVVKNGVLGLIIIIVIKCKWKAIKFDDDLC